MMSSPRIAPRAAVAAWVLLVAGSALLYGGTVAPGLLWGDDAMFQMSLATGALTSHPVWGMLAQFWARVPLGDPAFRANMASALYAAASSGCLFLIVYTLVHHWPPALLAGLALTISHTFWLHAVRAEVYTLHVFLFLGGLWALLRWRQKADSWGWLAVAAVTWLAGTINHLLMVLVLPGGLWLVVRSWSSSPRWRTWVWVAAGAMVSSLLLFLAFPGLLSEVSRSARYVLSSFRLTPGRLILAAVLLVYQFPFAGLLVPAGIVFVWHYDRLVGLGLLLMAVPTALFALAFAVPDSYVYFLPMYALCALLAGLGAPAIAALPSRKQFLLAAGFAALQIVLYRATPLALDRVAPSLLGARELTERPANEFFLWPSKRGYNGARRFSEAALQGLAPQAIIAADWTLYTPLMYLQTVEGQRPDVWILEMSSAAIPILHDHRLDRPLYLADDYAPYYALDALSPDFELQPSGNVFRLNPRSGAP